MISPNAIQEAARVQEAMNAHKYTGLTVGERDRKKIEEAVDSWEKHIDRRLSEHLNWIEPVYVRAHPNDSSYVFKILAKKYREAGWFVIENMNEDCDEDFLVISPFTFYQGW